MEGRGARGWGEGHGGEGKETERNVCPWKVPLVKQRKEKGEGNHEGNGRSS